MLLLGTPACRLYASPGARTNRPVEAQLPDVDRRGGNRAEVSDAAATLAGMVDSGPGLRSGATPLAVRMRPTSLDEVAGQRHLLTPGSPLVALAGDRTGESGSVSVILWGPPGTGKTTLAQAIARSSGRKFVELSAVSAGVRDVRQVMEEARASRDLYGLSTVLFLDEIHRFTKAQQDALLPGVENGWVILVAATTENPSFSVISPLLSRSLLLTLELLTDDDLGVLVDRAVTDPRGLAGAVELEAEARAAIIRLASGDARRALTALEAASVAATQSTAADRAAVTADEDGDDDDGDAGEAGDDATDAAASVPDVVIACAGDVPTVEAVAAAQLLRHRLPDLQVRVVNVVDLMRLQDPSHHPHGLPGTEFDALFTRGAPVIFAFHGYGALIHQLAYRRTNHDNLHVRGFIERGTTTTPFDMLHLNDLDRYRLALDVLHRVPGLAGRPGVAEIADEWHAARAAAREYAYEHGEGIRGTRGSCTSPPPVR